MFSFGRPKEEEQETSNELHTLRTMLDYSDNIIMLADTSAENVIFYMNKTARDTFARLRGELNSKFSSGADVTKAFQHSIHQFHPDPGRIRRILADLAARTQTQHDAMIPIGDITFKTKVFPIWDSKDSSKLHCFMASFQDVSAELLAEKLQQTMNGPQCWNPGSTSSPGICMPLVKRLRWWPRRLRWHPVPLNPCFPKLKPATRCWPKPAPA